jgi:hypothetical protein
MSAHIRIFSIALWWGSLTSIGFIVVPLLFMHLESPQVAGRMAALLFNALGYIAWICGAFLLTSQPSKRATWLIGFALLVSILIHFGVSPHIVARDNLRFWHSAGTALFAIEWLCLSMLLFSKSDPRRHANQPIGH